MAIPVSQSRPTPPGIRGWLLAPEPKGTLHASLQQFYQGWLKFREHPLGIVGLVVILILIFTAAAAPLLTQYDPVAQNMAIRLSPPSWDHILGTDNFGRDVFARIIYGARTTLDIIILVTIIVAPIGLLIGTCSGYFGGIVDEVLMRITDIFLSFPGLVLALGFAAALGPGITNAIIAISLTAWPPIARLARAETLSLRQMDYIAAVRLQGASSAAVITRHILPMCVPSVIVRVTLNMAGIILTAAGLGFLGLGAQPPWPEWGAMAATGREFMLDSPWVIAAPGIAIAVVSLAFNLVGDALRDVLDPRGGE
ncbi:ABC-type dipeptide/oligopeptide/nickel transport system, permease component (plasmid) [Neorhizobium galegae bv. officinalis bv. officinalis str. HAMBI 1141]|uniref:ABC-type dipeptide/oligopeptide/nickel transport system, permease component n=1 Tax=Neorhizobium galegae bv. officinalis bv. officinalis str. HAMBI 1141 TaxID=1028801 RepID=A0A068TF33_NEOGA|nr:ABC transporter permease [Neorhizobium galegae]CDN57097.1 ABC-type dipeptide/oligopeptide/nickel transport system, permease component [Neorhizobium galegae bv. officinalis bv. officinalis str. HAMBI 1141]